MSLDPAPLLDAARWGRPWHDVDGCTLCERGTDSDRVPACVSPTDIAETLGVSRSTVQKWRSGQLGLSQKMAERCAATLGLLDHEVWPELLEDAIAEVQRACETCGAVFVLTRSDKRFCSANCRNRSAAAMAKQRERSRVYARERYASDPEYREAKRRAVRERSGSVKRAAAARQRDYYRRTAERQRADRRARYRREQAA